MDLWNRGIPVSKVWVRTKCNNNLDNERFFGKIAGFRKLIYVIIFCAREGRIRNGRELETIVYVKRNVRSKNINSISV